MPYFFTAAALQADSTRRLRSVSREWHSSRLRCTRNAPLAACRSRSLRDQSRFESRQFLLALRHAGGCKTGGTARSACDRFQHIGERKRGTRFRCARYLCCEGHRYAAQGTNDVPSEREFTRETKGHSLDAPIRAALRRQSCPSKDPMGRPIFWFTVIPLQGAEEGTDRWAVEHDWVSVTPLRLDLTDEKELARALALHHTPPINTDTSGTLQRNKTSRRAANKKARHEKSEP